ncbi:MAG: alpha-1,2-fucosyltransferase [Acidobacteriaceae bacterium]
MEMVVRQVSGLGNQLFQYAAGRYYAQRHGATLRMLVDPTRNAGSHGYERPFLLSHLRIAAPFARPGLLDRIFLMERSLVRPVAAALRRGLRVARFTEPIESRYKFLEQLPIGGDLRRLYLEGYWQTYRVPGAIEGELRQELRFRNAAQGRTLQVLQRIERSGQPVSLHIRRGDYTLAAEGEIALPISYALQAMERMRERIADPTFFIFSDDMAFARSELSSLPGVVFVDHNEAATSHEDLRLMSSCRHHILANSTFSWWGAWLNADPGKIVIAPRHWLRTRESYFPELLPPEWILLDTCKEESGAVEAKAVP